MLTPNARCPGAVMVRRFDEQHIARGGGQRITELLMAISLAADLVAGQPMGQTLRSSWLSVVLARELGCTPDETRHVLQVSLLFFLGCTADASEAASVAGGDEQAFNAAMGPAIMGTNRELLRALLRVVGAGELLPTRMRMLARVLADPEGKSRSLASHCEVASMLAGRLGLDAPVTQALGHAFERWDGTGDPARLRGDAIPAAARIALVACDADLFSRLGEDPARPLLERAGKAYDPTVVDAFVRTGPSALADFDAGDGWSEVLGCEPAPHATIDGGRLARVCHALADFADLKSIWMRGHSPSVADLAESAGAEMGLGDGDRRTLRHAGLVHDLGRVGVVNGIWDKPGPLTAEEWERVRLHPYLTHRVLSRCCALAPLADLASAHHERLDRSGYHRGVGLESLSISQRILAAADVYAAISADRPYRPAFSRSQAAILLDAEARAGNLDAEAVDAVLAAAGVTQREGRRHWPAGLTVREVEVLRLLARGWTNRRVAGHLSISPKTVGRHVENIYLKAGVSTRAGAALFAMEHRLLD
jgi:HD-GYP domain-containing protein (c-di-GMP phosphodiesterase class II)